MNKPVVLYLIRSEADLERIVSIAISGKKYADQHFIYYGDIHILFDYGIKNRFQKHLLSSNGFKVLDAVTFLYLGKIYKILKHLKVKNRTVRETLDIGARIFNKFIYTFQDKNKLSNKLLNKLKPSILITDNAEERLDYFPHCLRQAAIKRNIKIHVTGHGPAGGLHKEYHEYKMTIPSTFKNCIVGICSKHDYGYGMPNRMITGDPADGYPHLLLKHDETYDDIDFYNERKYKIGFFMSAPFETCTNSWSIMEDIMLDYSFREDVAMAAKFHPRLYKLGDYRYLKKIDNLKLYGPELDRTRLVKWADIVVCSDHCSMLFEGMILQKKVVAIHSKKVRPFASFKSKIHGCDPSMNSIYSANEFNLDGLTQYTSDTKFIDEYCWGGLGKIDLGKNILKEILDD
ncbi:MAG: hypothetical protein HN601_06300 [Candidatus Marinimicrobia bacterium]|mgnify:FL=1|nr:hypothetical protein [Candidatus Neomarinimicrobiota bacterium]